MRPVPRSVLFAAIGALARAAAAPPAPPTFEDVTGQAFGERALSGPSKP